MGGDEAAGFIAVLRKSFGVEVKGIPCASIAVKEERGDGHWTLTAGEMRRRRAPGLLHCRQKVPQARP